MGNTRAILPFAQQPLWEGSAPLGGLYVCWYVAWPTLPGSAAALMLSPGETFTAMPHFKPHGSPTLCYVRFMGYVARRPGALERHAWDFT